MFNQFSDMWNKKKLLGLAIIGMTVLSAVAQQNSNPQILLDAVNKNYQSYSNVKINFTIKAVDAQGKVNVNEQGELYSQPKTDKFHLIIPDQEIISDGKTQWTVLKEEEEVQVTGVDGDAEHLTPASIFTFYQKGYQAVPSTDEQINGRILKVVDLTPLDRTKSFSKVRLRIDPAKKQIFDARVFDKGGGSFTYTIQKLTPNTQLSPKTFIFDQATFPNMEVVDLR